MDPDAVLRRISIHALRGESDACPSGHTRKSGIFQSTPSVGRATATRVRVAGVHRISIHALREESDVDTFRFACGHVISIHALREEGDTPVHRRSAKSGYFNPRPPRGGRLFFTRANHNEKEHFNPRPPRGGRREGKTPFHVDDLFQSTPSARRATFLCAEQNCLVPLISIHALREEGDSHLSGCTTRTIKFQSTPSARRATNAAQAWSQMQSISIHALREESDTVRMGKKQRRKNFNPRPPRGERRTAFSTNSSSRLFQSTPSARRATSARRLREARISISIHALREEGDALWACFRCAACLFQSTPSARRATPVVD